MFENAESESYKTWKVIIVRVSQCGKCFVLQKVDMFLFETLIYSGARWLVYFPFDSFKKFFLQIYKQNFPTQGIGTYGVDITYTDKTKQNHYGIVA